jgi:hypothetical protein
VHSITNYFRRSAAKAGREAGTSESVIMKMAGWQTRSMFERNTIMGDRDREQAVQQLEAARTAQREAAKVAPEPRTEATAPIEQAGTAATVAPRTSNVQ